MGVSHPWNGVISSRPKLCLLTHPTRARPYKTGGVTAPAKHDHWSLDPSVPGLSQESTSIPPLQLHDKNINDIPLDHLERCRRPVTRDNFPVKLEPPRSVLQFPLGVVGFKHPGELDGVLYLEVDLSSV